MSVDGTHDLSRSAHLARLTAVPLDVLVIGGGITGAGVALDAVTRGYRVGLVERSDFASGTSSRSTKLVHGGIRYLAKGEIGLVRDALRERTLLLRLAPHLVRPQPFVIPLYGGLRRPLGLRVPAPLRPLAPLGVGIGLWAYDRFARSPGLDHLRLAAGDVARLLSDVRLDGLLAAYLYYDGRTDDVRLTHAVLATARRAGAITVNHAPVVALMKSGGAVAGARIEDRLTGRVHDLRARHVVNAAGVWAEQIAAMDAEPTFRITHSKGVHLVLRTLWSDTALVIPETDDGRLLFLVPWAGRTILGTTDTPYAGPLDSPVTTPDDIAYLLDHANRYLRRPLVRGDVVGAFAGLRPLIGPSGGPSSALSREHAVVVSPGGLVSIIGGKLTSYRKMAEDTVNAIVHRDGFEVRCRTASLTLVGSEGLDAARDRVAHAAIPDESRAHLLETYGSAAAEVVAIGEHDPDLLVRLAPACRVLAVEAAYACRAEMLVTLADWMVVRSRLGVLSEDGGRGAVQRVAAIMARELGWDAGETRRQHEMWEAAVDRERAAVSP